MLTGDRAAEAASLVSGPFRASPPAFVAPADDEDLALLVGWAGRHRTPLIPRGGGTGMPGGNLGRAVVVSLGEAFAGIEHRTAEGGSILRTGAGAIAGEADAAARKRGRFLPPLPSSAAWCSMGGMAANNAAGARSFRHGACARWITALEGIDARGEPFRYESGRGEAHSTPLDLGLRPAHRDADPPGRGEAHSTPLDLPVETDEDGFPRGWPRVRKNSSGYALDRYLPAKDLVQLLVGSEGTLAFLTAVEWSTAAIPPSRGIAVLPARSNEEIVEIARGVRELDATSCEFLGRRFLEMARLEEDPLVGAIARGAHGLLLIEVDGEVDEVEAALAAAAALGRGVAGAGVARGGGPEVDHLWALRRGASPLIARAAARGLVSTQFIEDSVVPVPRLGDYLAGLDEILAEAAFDAVVFGHAGDGNVHVNPLVDMGADDWTVRVRTALERVADLVAELGGTLAGEHGDGRLRAPFLEKIWGPENAAAFREVKRHFDPHGIMNPGVIIPLPGQDPLEGFAPRPRVHPPVRLAPPD